MDFAALAAEVDSKEVEMVLIDAGADMNSRTISGSTPSSIAENKGYAQIIDLPKDALPVMKAQKKRK